MKTSSIFVLLLLLVVVVFVPPNCNRQNVNFGLRKYVKFPWRSFFLLLIISIFFTHPLFKSFFDNYFILFSLLQKKLRHNKRIIYSFLNFFLQKRRRHAFHYFSSKFENFFPFAHLSFLEIL